MAEEAAHNCVTRNVTLFPAVYSSIMLYCIGRVQKHEKNIFFQNSPAVRFFSQHFRKWEIKKNLMAAEFGVDLFF